MTAPVATVTAQAATQDPTYGWAGFGTAAKYSKQRPFLRESTIVQVRLGTPQRGSTMLMLPLRKQRVESLAE
jgi:hypothetical protein